jgi:small subunit ribosomal protein S9
MTEQVQQNVDCSATGRRKTSVARVRLMTGTGKCTVNNREFAEYFNVESQRSYILQPMEFTKTVGQFDIVVKVSGGGPSGQAGAMRHALSRALLLADGASKDTLKSRGCLTRDPRMKERKKPGQPGARKRFQFSKR